MVVRSSISAAKSASSFSDEFSSRTTAMQLSSPPGSVGTKFWSEKINTGGLLFPRI
jgi:hypothetical protein